MSPATPPSPLESEIDFTESEPSTPAFHRVYLYSHGYAPSQASALNAGQGSPQPASTSSNSSTGSDKRHRRRRLDGQPPRPPNPFLLFRQAQQNKLRKIAGDSRSVSSIAGAMWRGLGQEEREYWKRLAGEKKAEHMAKYPDYRFKPTQGVIKKKRNVKRPTEYEIARQYGIADLAKHFEHEELEGKVAELEMHLRDQGLRGAPQRHSSAPPAMNDFSSDHAIPEREAVPYPSVDPNSQVASATQSFDLVVKTDPIALAAQNAQSSVPAVYGAAQSYSIDLFSTPLDQPNTSIPQAPSPVWLSSCESSGSSASTTHLSHIAHALPGISLSPDSYFSEGSQPISDAFIDQAAEAWRAAHANPPGEEISGQASKTASASTPQMDIQHPPYAYAPSTMTEPQSDFLRTPNSYAPALQEPVPTPLSMTMDPHAFGSMHSYLQDTDTRPLQSSLPVNATPFSQPRSGVYEFPACQEQGYQVQYDQSYGWAPPIDPAYSHYSWSTLPF